MMTRCCLLASRAAVLCALIAGLACAPAGVEPNPEVIDVQIETMPDPEELAAPAPRADAQGAFCVPYRADGHLADWALSIRQRVAAGELEAEPEDPLATRNRALELLGGYDMVTASSDQSFDDVADLAVFMYVGYSRREGYDETLEATCILYPQLRARYRQAVVLAPRRGDAMDTVDAADSAYPVDETLLLPTGDETEAEAVAMNEPEPPPVPVPATPMPEPPAARQVESATPEPGPTPSASPRAAAPSVRTGTELVVIFQWGTSILAPEGIEALHQVAERLRGDASRRAVVYGASGPQMRAIQLYLVGDEGIDPARIVAR